MFEDAILDSDSLHSFNHCKISVIYFFPRFNKAAEIPNAMGMGHVPKILEKIPELIADHQTLSEAFLGSLL
jgi:hypothetical protein